MDKTTQRKKVLAQLKKMSETEHRQKSAMIAEKLKSDPSFAAADLVGVTISSFPEVDTIALIESCWKQGKKVAVPKCDPLERKMDFYLLENFNQLETVYMKLLEPKINETTYIPPEKIDLMIVPGVVFSQSGYRIGFGGGYYDRYLAGYNGATRSLAFSEQLADEVPVEAHDIPVDGIITENRCIEIGQVDK